MYTTKINIMGSYIIQYRGIGRYHTVINNVTLNVYVICENVVAMYYNLTIFAPHDGETV